MNTSIADASRAVNPTGGMGRADLFKFQTPVVNAADSAQFRAALERHMHSAVGPTPTAGDSKNSLGDKIVGRVTDLAGQIKHDQQYVSKAIEQATRSADSTQLMKALMALNDYEMRVQFISKVASKATQSLDQLTKLQ